MTCPQCHRTGLITEGLCGYCDAFNRLRIENVAFRALLDPLPKLGCGAPARPGMEIWYLSSATPGEVVGPWTLRFFNAHGNGYVDQGGMVSWRELARMFSTPELAKAVAEKEGSDA